MTSQSLVTQRNAGDHAHRTDVRSRGALGLHGFSGADRGGGILRLWLKRRACATAAAQRPYVVPRRELHTMAIFTETTPDWSALPAPTDDGAARHLNGMRLPSVPLAATDGRSINLSAQPGRVVVYTYPRTG